MSIVPDAKRALYSAATEKEFLGMVLRYARLRGWLAIHHFDSRRSQRGFPDVLAVRGGRIVALELKTERGRVTEDQREWIRRLGECAGVEARIVRPSDWDEVLELLK